MKRFFLKSVVAAGLALVMSGAALAQVTIKVATPTPEKGGLETFINGGGRRSRSDRKEKLRSSFSGRTRWSNGQTVCQEYSQGLLICAGLAAAITPQIFQIT
jgi:Ni/Co efflux regulator RcnB